MVVAADSPFLDVLRTVLDTIKAKALA